MVWRNRPGNLDVILVYNWIGSQFQTFSIDIVDTDTALITISSLAEGEKYWEQNVINQLRSFIKNMFSE